MTVLLVHPHPDDESILTGGLILQAHARHRRVVLVTATRGEEGGGPRAGTPGDGSSLASVRTRELDQARTVLGVDRQVWLGFRDSGVGPAMGPHAFSAVPLAEAADPIADALRDERPEVVVTATPDGTYGHPDHVRAHDATLAALDQLRLEGWAPDTIAMVAFPRGVAALVVHAVLAFGLRPSGWLLREASSSELPGTAVRFLPLDDLLPRKRQAMLAHQSQLRGRLRVIVRQPALCRLVFGVERYLVAGRAAGELEDRTLFAHV